MLAGLRADLWVPTEIPLEDVSRPSGGPMGPHKGLLEVLAGLQATVYVLTWGPVEHASWPSGGPMGPHKGLLEDVSWVPTAPPPEHASWPSGGSMGPRRGFSKMLAGPRATLYVLTGDPVEDALDASPG